MLAVWGTLHKLVLKPAVVRTKCCWSKKCQQAMHSLVVGRGEACLWKAASRNLYLQLHMVCMTVAPALLTQVCSTHSVACLSLADIELYMRSKTGAAHIGKACKCHCQAYHTMAADAGSAMLVWACLHNSKNKAAHRRVAPLLRSAATCLKPGAHSSSTPIKASLQTSHGNMATQTLEVLSHCLLIHLQLPDRLKLVQLACIQHQDPEQPVGFVQCNGVSRAQASLFLCLIVMD